MMSRHSTLVKNHGLFISPLRQKMSVDPGGKTQGLLTIANHTNEAMTVALSYEQFSVTDYSYVYNFKPPQERWVAFAQNSVVLQPNKSKTIHFTVAPTKDATPGGHYFTLFASAFLKRGGISSEVRAANVVYATVNGDLHYSGKIVHKQVPWIALADAIPFSLGVKNTGNVHYFAFPYARVEGINTKEEKVGSAHFLFPGTTRNIEGAIPHPVFPGVYSLHYGYKTDHDTNVEQSQLFVYVPTWLLLLLAGIVIVCVAWRGSRKRRRRITIGP